jgi:hypothetical protein
VLANVIAHTCKAVVFVLGVYFIATGWPIAGLIIAAVGLVALLDGNSE